MSDNKKAYVVREIGWEYNDQNYYRGEYDGGKMEKAFFNKERADKFCKEKNIKDFRDIYDIGSYFEECLKLSKNQLNSLRSILKNENLTVDDINDTRDAVKFKLLNDDQIEEVMKIFPQIVFWEVVPVDFEM